MKRLYVHKSDIENGESDEKLVKIFLALKGIDYPELFWSALVKQALEFGTNRRTISSEFLKKQFEIYLVDEKKEVQSIELVKLTDENLIVNRDIFYATSEELVEVLNSGEKYRIQHLSLNTEFILELIRFKKAEKNDYKVKSNNTLILRHGIELKVLHRTATYTEMEKWMERNININSSSSIVRLEGNFNNVEEEYPLAILHRKKLVNELSNLKLECIHCGKPIFAKSDAIEVDNTSENLKVGLVHTHCLRPIDRVFGHVKSELFNRYSFLKNFDFYTWMNLLNKGGQRAFLELKDNHFNQVSMMWNKNSKNYQRGDYYLINYLEDGSTNYQRSRGRIIRGSYEEMERVSSTFNVGLMEAKKNGEPFGYLSISQKFGNYQMMKQFINVGEKFLECERTEAKKYNSLIRELDDIAGDYYTPLVYISIDGKPLIVDGTLFFITNPLELNLYLENLLDVFHVDIGAEEYSIEIIDSDTNFDILMEEVTKNNLSAIVDPYFGKQGELLRGIVLEELPTQ